jgi:Patatin phospholipase
MSATMALSYEGHSKDYEFSRVAMEEHWRAGYHDARRTLRHREVLERPTNRDGVFTSILLPMGASRSEARRAKAMAHPG